MLVIAVVVAAVPAMYLIASVPSGSSAVYQVIDENLTLRGQAAVVPCMGFNSAVCPSAANASLYPVELIKFGGEDYYLSSYTEYPSGQSVGCVNSICSTETGPIGTYTVWFTNSTVYCISPAHPFTNTARQNRTCPTSPYHVTTVVVPTPSASALGSTIGLRLDLSLASNSNGSIGVVVDEFNILDHLNNITADTRWPVNQFLWTRDVCGPPTGVPMGYAILQGDYSQTNFTTGTPLYIEAEPSSLLCPYEAPTPYYAFKPLSDVAATYEWGNIPGLAGVYNVTASSEGAWSGYWAGSASQYGLGSVNGNACPGQASTVPVQVASSGCPLVFNQFSPGEYTVVAADEWGQVALLHFTVQDG
jgi:hypothetical protein